MSRLEKFAAENRQNILSSTLRREGGRTSSEETVMPNSPNMTNISKSNDVEHSLPTDPPDPVDTGPENSFSTHRSPGTSYLETPLANANLRVDLHLVTVESEIESLHDKVERYGLELKGEEGWISLIDPRFNSISKEIDLIERKCLAMSRFDLVLKLSEIRDALKLFQTELRKQVGNAPTTGIRPLLNPPTLVVPIQSSANEGFSTPLRNISMDVMADNRNDDIDDSLEETHQLISTIQESTGMENPSSNTLVDVMSFFPQIQRLPEIVNFMDSLKSLRSLDDKLIEIKRFNEKCGDRSDILDICATLDNQNKELSSIQHTLNQFQLKVGSELSSVKSSSESMSNIVNVQSEKIAKCTQMVQQAEVSIKAVMRWLLTLEDSVQGQVSTRANLSQRLMGSPELTGSRCDNQLTGADIGLTNSNGAGICPSSSVTHQNGHQVSNPQATMNSQANVNRSHNQNTTGTRQLIFSQSQSCPASPTVCTNDIQALSRSRIPSNDSISSTSSSLARVHERRLLRIIDEIDSLIQQDITGPTSDDIIMDLHSNVVADITRLSKECDDKCIAYAKLADHNETVIDSASDASAKGYSYVTEVKRIYRERQLHLHTSANPAITGSLNLKKFNGDSSQTVYEFFHKFDQFTKGSYTLEQKALLLYSSYLDDKLKQELVLKKNSYHSMKEWCIKKFGRVKGIVDGKLESLTSRKYPGDTASSSQKANYYRHIYSVLAEIKNLPESSQISPDELALFSYTFESLKKIMLVLPETLVNVFLAKLRKNNLDTEYPAGEKAFNIIMEVLQTEYTDRDTTSRLSLTTKASLPNKERSKGTHADLPPEKQIHNVTVDNGPTSPLPSASVHFQQGSKKGAEGSAKPKSKRPKWYNTSLRFPCPMKNHVHELGTCKDFFEATPAKVRQFSLKKLCYSCLGPWDKCPRSCHNLKKIPSNLTCRECHEDIKRDPDSNKSPLSILTCSNVEHSKLSADDLAQACEKWFPGFSATKMKGFFPSVSLVAFTSRCLMCKHNSVINV